MGVNFQMFAGNFNILWDGLLSQGFVPFLPRELNAPIIATFHQPTDPKFVFQNFYNSLAARGYVIYPGKLTNAQTFRVGCIGQLADDVMPNAVQAVKEVLAEMGVSKMT